MSEERTSNSRVRARSRILQPHNLGGPTGAVGDGTHRLIIKNKVIRGSNPLPEMLPEAWKYLRSGFTGLKGVQTPGLGKEKEEGGRV